MANKYIRHGETFNGDGTTSAAATNNGGVGAWNTITYLEGTTPAFGALVDGDTVYVRSQDAANANISRTLAASVSLGNAVATAGAFITWIIDNGLIWSGIDGTITYTSASTWVVTNRQYNRIVSKTPNSFIVKNTSTNQSAGTTMCINNGEMVNTKFDWTAKTGPGQCYAVQLGESAVLENPKIDWGAIGGTATDQRGLIRGINSTTGKITVICPEIILNNSTVGMPIFYPGDTSRALIGVTGGSISGAGATSGQPLFCPSNGNASSFFRSIGLQFPRTMDVVNSTYETASAFQGTGSVEVIGCDGGVGGHLEKEWGFATSRTDSNPPTLQALLPNSTSTQWSWRVYPKSAANVTPMMLQSMKLFTGAATTKTITQEILVANTMAPHKGNLWMTVEYTDNATGAIKHLSTRDYANGALDSSTAAWSASVWGAITFNKQKLEIATPTSIKQDTPIVVTIWSSLPSASANDVYFIDPDFGVN